MSLVKFLVTHEIIVPGPESRLTISVMLRGHNLWQRSEHLRGTAFPIWHLVAGRLYRHGVAAPEDVIVRQLGGRAT